MTMNNKIYILFINEKKPPEILGLNDILNIFTRYLSYMFSIKSYQHI